jgi:hypothetical protein
MIRLLKPWLYHSMNTTHRSKRGLNPFLETDTIGSASAQSLTEWRQRSASGLSKPAEKAWERFKTNMAPMNVEPAPSGLATPEPAGPAKVFDAVATGSSPASVGVLDMLEHKWRRIAEQRWKEFEASTSEIHATHLKSSAETYEACALELRLLTGRATERQPEENDEARDAATR